MLISLTLTAHDVAHPDLICVVNDELIDWHAVSVAAGRSSCVRDVLNTAHRHLDVAV